MIRLTITYLFTCLSFHVNAQTAIFKKADLQSFSSKKFFQSLFVDKQQFKNLRLVHDSLSGDEFWMDAQEVTNEEYRSFTDYCRDSIVMKLLGYVKSDARGWEVLGWEKKLSWTKDFGYSIQAILCFEGDTSQLHEDARLDVDSRKLIYGPDWLLYPNDTTAIYPDTLCWVKETGDSLSTKNYFSNHSFDHYPVVGVSYWQALAYCRWLQETWNSALQKAGNTTHYFEVRPPNENEWSAALKIESPQSQDMVYTLPAHIKGKKAIYNLSGNVAEWLYDSTDLQNNASNAKKITQSSLVKEIAEDELPATTQRSYVGFRYVVRLKAKEVALEQVNR